MSKTIIKISDYRSPFASLLTDPEAMRVKRTAEAQEHVRKGMTMYVGLNGVWWGTFPDTHTTDPTCNTSHTIQSFERIGYHSGSDYFLEAFLQAGGTVIFQGFNGIRGEVMLS